MHQKLFQNPHYSASPAFLSSSALQFNPYWRQTPASLLQNHKHTPTSKSSKFWPLLDLPAEIFSTHLNSLLSKLCLTSFFRHNLILTGTFSEKISLHFLSKMASFPSLNHTYFFSLMCYLQHLLEWLRVCFSYWDKRQPGLRVKTTILIHSQ